jgi:hypothetical protein
MALEVSRHWSMEVGQDACTGIARQKVTHEEPITTSIHTVYHFRIATTVDRRHLIREGYVSLS